MTEIVEIDFKFTLFVHCIATSEFQNYKVNVIIEDSGITVTKFKMIKQTLKRLCCIK